MMNATATATAAISHPTRDTHADPPARGPFSPPVRKDSPPESLDRNFSQIAGEGVRRNPKVKGMIDAFLRPDGQIEILGRRGGRAGVLLVAADEPRSSRSVTPRSPKCVSSRTSRSSSAADRGPARLFCRRYS